MVSCQPSCFVNGRWETSISGANRGLAYGDGVFETMLLRGGRLPYLPSHWDRLAEGVEKLCLTVDWDRLEAYLADFLDALARRPLTDGVVKLILTRGEGGRGYQPAPEREATAILAVFPLPEVFQFHSGGGVDLFVCSHRLPDNARLAGCKHLNKLDYVLAAMEWRHDQYQEALLLDPRGHVVEATSRNIFIKIEQTLITPPLRLSGVKGVMRRLIMEYYAPALALTVVEKNVSLDTVLAADEVLLCNSITGIWPVKSIADEAVPTGPTTRALQRSLQDDLQRRLQPAGVSGGA